MYQQGQNEIETLSVFERIRLTWRLLRDVRVPVWMKGAVPAIAALYLIVPIDLIPDFVLGLGQIDDLSVIGVSLFVMTKILPRIAPGAITAEHLAAMRGRGPERTERDNATYVDATFRYADRPTGESR